MQNPFDNPPSLKAIKSKSQRTDYNIRIRLSQSHLNRFEGKYSPDIAPEIQVRVEVTDIGPIIHNSG